MISEDGYLGQLPSNVMNGHALIQAHASDTLSPQPIAVS